MGVSAAGFWWIAAGIAVAAELTTGTFYLLMIALGLAAGAVAAHLGVSSAAQVIVASLLGGGATALWHWRRMRAPRSEPVARNRDAHLDVGERVHVDAWNADRTARVTYRGSAWTVRLAPDAAAALPGEHMVAAVEGNWLVLAPLASR
jgi:membrane protein implicated in regulation of membrane protease activity